MRRALVTAILGCVALVWMGPSADASAAQHLFLPQSSPKGMTYSQWEGAYQIWLNEIPLARNPAAHPNSSENCAVVQGAVFVGPNGSDCDMPAGYPVVVSGGFWECSTAEGLGDTWAELRQCARDNFVQDFGRQSIRLTLRIDGQEVAHCRRWTFLSPGEIIVFPKHNLFGATPGASKSVTRGFVWILRPLTPGDHDMQAHVKIVGGGALNFDWMMHAA